MSKQDDYQNYPGFDDADDFLPTEADLQHGTEGTYADQSVWTGKRRIRPLMKLIMFLLVAGALFVVLNATLLKIRSVRVNGNRTIPASTIAELAGLNRDMGYFTVDVARVREGVEQNPYLKFVDLRKQLPGTVVLFVKERAPCANVQGGGTMYLVDEDAYVLQTINDVKNGNTLPVVIGMQVSEARPGSQVISSRPGKVDEYRAIIEELLLQGVVNQFTQIDITDSDHIYLRHTSGYMAELGTAKELMAKIGTLRAVISALQADGLMNGYIDVTIPGEAIYSPQ